eukprot:679150-Pyramimonas_sp.AAC.1
MGARWPAPLIWLTPNGSPAKRGWCSRSAAIDVWGCNTHGACNAFPCAEVLLGFRLQHIGCNTMRYRSPA